MLWLVDRWLCAEKLPDESVLRDGQLAHWDHLGRTGIETAKHFRAHLLEFLVSRELTHLATGLDSLHPSHGEAWCVGASDEMQVVIEALRPRRLESCFAEPSAAPPPN